MITCPKCQAENRAGARFCKSCASALPLVTVPLDSAAETLNELLPPTRPRPGQATLSPVMPRSLAETRPLETTDLVSARPPDAIFGDAFLHKSLIFSGENENRYLVTQLNIPEESQIRVCPNDDCGAFFSPVDQDMETFCTNCGARLGVMDQELVLIETPLPIPENLQKIVEMALSHSHIRTPLLAFEEQLEGGMRYCLVMPHISTFERHPDGQLALLWGEDLARALDYLHTNRVSYNGQINNNCLAIDGDRIVWANFNPCSVYPEGTVVDGSPDVRSLALVIFHWLTGRPDFERDPNLLPALNKTFEHALVGAGYGSALEFADALSQAQGVSASPQAVDYQLGRRTHVGMLRSLNEDSLMTVEMNRIHQSISTPLGVYVVADGMGGHAAGEIASGTIINSIATQALSNLMPSQIMQSADQDRLAWLSAAVEGANNDVFALRKSAGTDMGSTLVAAVMDGTQAHIAHVGDSRAYRVNAGGIIRLTTDHSLVERLIATNQITPEEARYHPQRNVIYRTIGDKAKIDVEVATHSMAVGDYLLLCSDGLSGMVEDQTIYQIVVNAASPQSACDQLIDAANSAGGEDNVTAIIVHIVQS
ncbi:Stp1/IreP family PP2C-type Ser/Thr phosphatase [Chloroflexota bacterium]